MSLAPFCGVMLFVVLVVCFLWLCCLFLVAVLIHVLTINVTSSLPRARIKAKPQNPKNLKKTKNHKTKKNNVLGELWARNPHPPNVSGNIGFIVLFFVFLVFWRIFLI